MGVIAAPRLSPASHTDDPCRLSWSATVDGWPWWIVWWQRETGRIRLTSTVVYSRPNRVTRRHFYSLEFNTVQVSNTGFTQITAGYSWWRMMLVTEAQLDGTMKRLQLQVYLPVHQSRAYVEFLAQSRHSDHQRTIQEPVHTNKAHWHHVILE